MSIIEFITLVMAIATALGLVMTWINNGVKAREEKAELLATIKGEIEGLKNILQDPDYGVFCKLNSLENRIASLENKLERLKK